MRSILLLILFVSTQFSFIEINPEQKAYNHIRNIKKGVILVRLHTDDVVIEQMKKLQQHRTLKRKQEEIQKKNREMYGALTAAYDFSEIRFFYARDSKKVAARTYENIFLNSDLELDMNITIPENIPVYILDVGDIYFEAISGHMEGIMVMDNQFEALEKPFPFYVRKRSGISIIKRTDLDVAMLLNKNFKEFYSIASTTSANR
jgi:hypothetical protein